MFFSCKCEVPRDAKQAGERERCMMQGGAGTGRKSRLQDRKDGREDHGETRGLTSDLPPTSARPPMRRYTRSAAERFDAGTLGPGLDEEAEPRVRVLLHEADLACARLIMQSHEAAAARDEVLNDIGEDARDEGEELGRLLREERARERALSKW